MACFPHSQILVWVIALALAQAACYVVHKENVDLVTEVNDGTHAGADLGDDETISDEAMLESMFHFIHSKKLQMHCTAEATSKASQLLKEKKRKWNNIPLKKNYQNLEQRVLQSIARKRDWLSAIKSEICSSCLLKKICDHPPKYLPR